MAMLDVKCPYCGLHMSVATDGLYTPKYHICDKCMEQFVYEPRKTRVASFRMGEADAYTDPDLREIEFGAYDEQ